MDRRLPRPLRVVQVCEGCSFVLAELDIRDFAVAEHVRVQFAPGLNAITGETGAGKSIIVDALGLLLGGRAEPSDVRAGAPVARVEGIFHFAPGAMPEELAAALHDAGVDLEDESLIVSRELSISGRARTTARINGHAVVQSALIALGSRLIDIYGQTDHVALLQPAEHIRYLDRFAGTVADRGAFAASAQRLRDLRARLARLLSDQRERTRRQDRLAYECAEIEAAQLRADEEDELRAEQQLLANAEQLVGLADGAYAALQGGSRGGGAVDVLGRADDAVQQLARLDARLAELAAAAAALQEQAADLARELRSYRDNVEYNPARISAIDDRLAVLTGLKRKYGATVAEVIAYGEQARTELSELEGSEEQRQRMELEQTSLVRALGERAEALGRRREAAAQRLAIAIEEQLGEMRMNGARFAVSFTRRPAGDGVPVSLTLSRVVGRGGATESAVSADPVQFDASGVDRVEFLVTLNPGEPLRPLARVASGGETSRLMLALETVLGDADSVPVLVFDEIEAGLGGRTGGVVGEKLARLARHHQVICISHLPQIAARADRHLSVVKSVKDGRTHVEVATLGREGRIQELAAMLGTVTPATLDSARELLDDRSTTGDSRAGKIRVSTS